MNYYGEFTSYTGKNYRVDFYTDKGTGSKELTLGDSPFVTDMSSDNDTIYAPVKPTGATVQINTDRAEFDLYTESPTGVRVTLTDTDNSEIVWSGYTTPCMFDMPFEQEYETLEIECVDILSVLQSMKYVCEKNTAGKSLRELRSFGFILNRIFGAVGVRYLYITDAIQISSQTASDSVIEKFMINEDNFFDKQDDIMQTEYDLAWPAYDIISEICKYLGYTAVSQGQDIFIFDYDSVSRGNSRYFRYTVDGKGELKSRTTVNMPYSFGVSGQNVAGSINLSLTPLYNKVSVKDEFHTQESMLSDSDFRVTNITDGSGKKPDTGPIYFFDSFEDSDVNGEVTNKQFAVWYAKPDGGVPGKYYATAYKFLKHEDIETFYYDFSQPHNRINVSEQKKGLADIMGNKLGCTYVDVFRNQIKEAEFNNWKDKYSDYNSLTPKARMNAWGRLFGGNISFKKTFIMRNWDNIEYKIGPGGFYTNWSFSVTENEDCRKYPYFTYRTALNDSVMAGGEDAYLRIAGRICHRQGSMIMTPMSGTGEDASKTDMNGDFKLMNQCFHWARLKVGDRYWNGKDWQSTACDFKLWILVPDGSHNKTKTFLKPDGGIKVYEYWEKAFDFINPEVSVELEEKGYYIPAPENYALTGNLEFTFYCPRDFYGHSRHNHWGGDKWKINGKKYKHDRYSRYYNSITILEDFDIDIVVSNGVADDQGRDTDTIYYNVLENSSVDELDEITFKITTFDNKNQAWSTPVIDDGTYKKQYVSAVYHKDMHSNMVRDNGRGTLLPEQMLIYRIVSQYEEPRVIYDYNISGSGHRVYGTYTDTVLSGRVYVADRISIDYRKDTAEITLIEKKI